MSADGITELGAVALAQAIAGRAVSCVEVMGAYLDRIERLNPAVNAIVALRPRADLVREAAAADAALAAGGPASPLHGFPLAIKDTVAVAGLPFTQGSPIFRDRVADTDAIMAERLRRGGALFIGKTNVPEFALGSHTFNEVYGATGNAYDPEKSAGGSSGGAAVAVALRLQPVADGSDHGGSLRNPPAFNNLFGLRPCYGRVPSEAKDVFNPSLAVVGALGRSPADIGLMLSVQAGYDARVPYSIPEDPKTFAGDLSRDFAGTRVAWLDDCGGHLAFEAGVLEVGRAALSGFEAAGCRVEHARPAYDMARLWEDWLVLRAWITAASLRPLYDDPRLRAQMKPEAAWEVERGLALDPVRLMAAQEGRGAWHACLRRFMGAYDFVAMPTTQVFPFDKGLRWPTSIAGRTMDTYHRWMETVIPATMSGFPALSVPAGFGAGGLPVGIQIIGPNHGELACLQLGAAYDAATGWVGRVRPALADA